MVYVSSIVYTSVVLYAKDAAFCPSFDRYALKIAQFETVPVALFSVTIVSPSKPAPAAYVTYALPSFCEQSTVQVSVYSGLSCDVTVMMICSPNACLNVTVVVSSFVSVIVTYSESVLPLAHSDAGSEKAIVQSTSWFVASKGSMTALTVTLVAGVAPRSAGRNTMFDGILYTVSPFISFPSPSMTVPFSASFLNHVLASQFLKPSVTIPKKILAASSIVMNTAQKRASPPRFDLYAIFLFSSKFSIS